MRIIFINRFYWPDEPATAQLLTDLAEALAARGHDVTVITSRPAGHSGSGAETHAGVRVFRVRSSHRGPHQLVGRAVDFITFLFGACWRLLWTAHQGDLVVAMTDPPSLGVAVWPVAWVKRARCLHWVQDIYPEVALVLAPGPLIRALGAVVRPGRNFAWKHSAGCVVLGRDMADFIAQTGVSLQKITVIPNWAPAGLEPQPRAAADQLRAAWNLQGRFVVAYSGNLGRVHDLHPVLAVAKALHDEPRIVFVFIGGGAQRAALENAVAAGRLTNVRFHAAQPRAELAATLALGDVHLVTLRAGCEALVFPSKLYGIAAVGRPVLFIGPRDCELSRLIAGRGFGFAFPRDETAAIADRLRQLAVNPGLCAELGGAAAEFSRVAGRLDHAVALWSERLSREAACR